MPLQPASDFIPVRLDRAKPSKGSRTRRGTTFCTSMYDDVRRFQPMTDFALFFPRRRIFFRQSRLGRLETGKRKSRDFNGLVYRGETAFGDPRQGIGRFDPKLRVRFSCCDCKDSRYNREWTERTPPESGTSSPSSWGMSHFRL